ncbi:MAG TPA: penicillin acylase family protein [Gammaproteobacteria bacterium]|nr:penicillin acylase family protein [Gammaproteobacteria bacterium]
MKLIALVVFATGLLLSSFSTWADPAPQAVARWEQYADNVTIYRDNWGIPHIYGKTDAATVFGMEYAQAEDGFARIERNYIDALGRRAEAEGESMIFHDLRMKLFVDPAVMKAKYEASPAWLKTLMNAAADGLNYYLYTHPDVHPKAIDRFEPWMMMAFSEGSIGGDIYMAVDVPELAAFYGVTRKVARRDDVVPELAGSNGIAISPSITMDHHALLLINPHVSFYFRDELHMVSEEGLNAYGAVTWGQFFIYQGFNAGAGWMHTSSGVENRIHYLETVKKKDSTYYYQYGDQWLPMKTRQITVPYKTPHGMAHKTFTAWYTQHGPIIARQGDKWVSVHLMRKPMQALIQDWTRMQATDYAAYRKTMQLHTNSSNNTIFADAEGNIAYWHSDWIPKRSDQFDWSQPVDGSNPATALHGVLSLKETPHLLNPASGWLYNSNNWPWSAAGKSSPKRADYPSYVDSGTQESPRGYHALRLLTGSKNWTAPKLAAAAYDSYLPAFAHLVPVLIKAYDEAPASAVKARLADPIEVLRHWDYRWGINSVSTSLAVFWGTDLYRDVHDAAQAAGLSRRDYIEQQATPKQLLASLAAAVDKLTADFGTWQTPWGQINRFQRISGDIEPHFDDKKPSIAIPFTTSRWGSLAASWARPYPNTKKWYGTGGNSFVAIVDFGPKVHAWAVRVGGESDHPSSPHFKDQATRYAQGNLRTVYYYKSQLQGHIDRQYHPGE